MLKVPFSVSLNLASWLTTIVTNFLEVRKKCKNEIWGPRLLFVSGCYAAVGCASGIYGLTKLVTLVTLSVVLAVSFLPRHAIVVTLIVLGLFFVRATWAVNAIEALAKTIPKTLAGAATVSQVLSEPGDNNCCLLCSQVRIIFPVRRDYPGNLLLRMRLPGTYFVGQKLSFVGRSVVNFPRSYNWQFDYQTYLRRKNIIAEVMVAKCCQISSGQNGSSLANTVALSLQQIRTTISSLHIKILGNEAGALLSSMVLGDRAVKLPDNITNNFRKLGLSHILAASGFNLTLVVACSAWILRLCGLNNLWANLICLVLMLGFSGLAGFSPSIVRSCIMITIVLLSRTALRSLHLPASLALALMFTLIVDPFQISDIGFQLSYLATLGIICGAAPLAKQIQEFLPARFPHQLTEVLSVVLLAQLSVLPVQLLNFWQIGTLFLLANLLVDPVVSIITVIGFASSLLSLAAWVAGMSFWLTLLDWIVAWPLRYILWLVNKLCAIEGTVVAVGQPAPYTVLVYSCAFAIFLLCLKIKRYVPIATFVLLVTVVFLVFPARPSQPLLLANANSICCLVAPQALVIGKSVDAQRCALYFGCSTDEQNNAKPYWRGIHLIADGTSLTNGLGNSKQKTIAPGSTAQDFNDPNIIGTTLTLPQLHNLPIICLDRHRLLKAATQKLCVNLVVAQKRNLILERWLPGSAGVSPALTCGRDTRCGGALRPRPRDAIDTRAPRDTIDTHSSRDTHRDTCVPKTSASGECCGGAPIVFVLEHLALTKPAVSKDQLPKHRLPLRPWLAKKLADKSFCQSVSWIYRQFHPAWIVWVESNRICTMQTFNTKGFFKTDYSNTPQLFALKWHKNGPVELVRVPPDV